MHIHYVWNVHTYYIRACYQLFCIYILVAGDPMSTKPVGYHPVATQQNFGGGYNRSSDRLALPSSETTVDHSRVPVSGGDGGNLSGLRKRLVKFVWFPSNSFKVRQEKATLLSSFTVSL